MKKTGHKWIMAGSDLIMKAPSPKEIRETINELFDILAQNPDKKEAAMGGIYLKKCDNGYEIWYEKSGDKRFKTKSF